MGYTNETTHYGIPLPLGSDLTTPMDYNEAFEDVDRDLYANTQAVTQTTGKVNDLEVALSTTNDNVTAVTGRVTTLEGTVATQGNAITQNASRIEEVEDDALDMICAVDEGTAQVATVAVHEGKYFRYNNVLYIATANIAIGDTIVPNTNCRATNVGTELEAMQGGTITAQGVSYDNTSSGLTSTNVQSAIDEVNGKIPTNEMKYLGTDNLTQIATTVSTFTIPADGLYLIELAGGSGAISDLKLGTTSGISIARAEANTASYVTVPLKAGTVLVTTASNITVYSVA